jgi:hypothetical protein
MDLCSNGHDEVCYEGRNCPACLIKEDRGYLEDDLIKLETKIRELEEELQREKEK